MVAMETFLEAASANRFADAQLCLDLSELASDTASAKRDEYAYKLKQIIDRMGWVDLASMPTEADWSTPYSLGDNMPGLVDEDLRDANRIVLARGPDGLWRFSPDTVAAIDALYDRWSSREQIASGAEQETLRKPFAVWLRTPEFAAAAATSMAIFSLVQYSKYSSLSRAMWKKLVEISEEGVPG